MESKTCIVFDSVGGFFQITNFSHDEREIGAYCQCTLVFGKHAEYFHMVVCEQSSLHHFASFYRRDRSLIQDLYICDLNIFALF